MLGSVDVIDVVAAKALSAFWRMPVSTHIDSEVFSKSVKTHRAMSVATIALFASLATYFVGWNLNQWSGSLSGVLFVMTLVTMFYWLAERYKFQPERATAARIAREMQQQRLRQTDAAPENSTTDFKSDEVGESLLQQPWWMSWTAGLFPVICGVFLVRSFLFEPFSIPSGSMLPTLQPGDQIFVNKFHYGLRLPVINKLVASNNKPQRGDVVVFRYPINPSIDLIKRVVAVPGDEINYVNKKLFINGKAVTAEQLPVFVDPETNRSKLQYSEQLGQVKHRILIDSARSAGIPADAIEAFHFRDHCRYTAESVICKVPEGHFFAMGDNRDDSQDSRFWGFVPESDIVGKASMIWMNFHNLNRIGAFN